MCNIAVYRISLSTVGIDSPEGDFCLIVFRKIIITCVYVDLCASVYFGFRYSVAVDIPHYIAAERCCAFRGSLLCYKDIVVCIIIIVFCRFILIAETEFKVRFVCIEEIIYADRFSDYHIGIIDIHYRFGSYFGSIVDCEAVICADRDKLACKHQLDVISFLAVDNNSHVGFLIGKGNCKVIRDRKLYGESGLAALEENFIFLGIISEGFPQVGASCCCAGEYFCFVSTLCSCNYLDLFHPVLNAFALIDFTGIVYGDSVDIILLTA